MAEEPNVSRAVVASATPLPQAAGATLNGVVTLWGPVNSLEEKWSIEVKAQHIAGANKVDNQLELKGP